MTPRTKLDAWLRAKDIKEEAFAETIGVRQGSVNRYRRGERTPRPAIAHRIVAATGGEVTFSDLYAPATAAEAAPC